jgi:hypothetical protein
MAPRWGQSSDFPAAGAGLGVAPTSVAPGLGTSSRSVERPATGAPVASLATAKIGAFAMGTAHAMTWIMLEPGWIVRDVDQGNAIEVRFEGARIH